MIFQGTFTAELFLKFVEERVLPYCNLYPGLQLVLILNNTTIYKSTHLQELCEEYNVLLKFLPPYSSDYNLIKAIFHDLKHGLRGITFWYTASDLRPNYHKTKILKS